MTNNLKKTYLLTKKLFPGINYFCRKCNTCCKTYGWLLKEEAKIFSKKKYSIVTINNRLYSIDSFKRDNHGQFLIDEIPRCRFFKNKKCAIQEDKPLDCRFYPIKVKIINKNQAYVGLSLGCKYVSSLSEKKLVIICKNIIRFWEKAPKLVLNNFLEMTYQINLISVPKRFWMKKVIKAERNKHQWTTYVDDSFKN